MTYKLSNEDARNQVASIKYALDNLTESKPIEGYAAEDEINEAINHLDAALVDLDDAILNEE